MLSSLFPNSNTNHPDLHSFPTRRSSDLKRIAGVCGDSALISLMSCRPSKSGMTRSLRTRSTEFDRSEEHTSELQSQSNLVCRLLLEKKKVADRRQIRSSRARAILVRHCA